MTLLLAIFFIAFDTKKIRNDPLRLWFLRFVTGFLDSSLISCLQYVSLICVTDLPCEPSRPDHIVAPQWTEPFMEVVQESGQRGGHAGAQPSQLPSLNVPEPKP